MKAQQIMTPTQCKIFRCDSVFHKAWSITLLFLTSMSLPGVAKTDELMRAIETRGTIRIGFQEDVTPFSSYDEITQTYRGFSVDMAEQLWPRV